ncbi:MAG: NAD(P)/FAD-dependent oxidoreductase [Tetrasphaera sp.]
MLQRIAIVGGGIAGLTLAAALDPSRFEVVVHEAQPERVTVGGALGLWPAALRGLARIGARGAVEGAGSRPRDGALWTITGERLAGGQVAPLMVPRPALMDALRAVAPASARIVHAEITDPTRLDADLVVGADGVRSLVRGLVHPPAAERIETPFVALRGLLAHDVPPDVVGEYWGPGLLFGIVPVRTGLTYWFTSHRSLLGPEPLSAATVLEEARVAFADAAPVVMSTLAAAGPDTSATRIWTAPALPRFVRDRYLVIGDAAHAMTPNLARGACDAIIDAITLADSLHGDRLGATLRLRLWQARRLPFTQAARVISGGVMRLALLDRGHRHRDRMISTVFGSRHRSREE